MVHSQQENKGRIHHPGKLLWQGFPRGVGGGGVVVWMTGWSESTAAYGSPTNLTTLTAFTSLRSRPFPFPPLLPLSATPPPGGWNGAIPGDGKVAVWPDVVGLDGILAAETIQKSRPDLKIVNVVPLDAMVTRDMRFDRVRVYVDKDGTVAKPPRVG